jgi:hypothetical protein
MISCAHMKLLVDYKLCCHSKSNLVIFFSSPVRGEVLVFKAAWCLTSATEIQTKTFGKKYHTGQPLYLRHIKRQTSFSNSEYLAGVKTSLGLLIEPSYCKFLNVELKQMMQMSYSVPRNRICLLSSYQLGNTCKADNREWFVALDSGFVDHAANC